MRSGGSRCFPGLSSQRGRLGAGDCLTSLLFPEHVSLAAFSTSFSLLSEGISLRGVSQILFFQLRLTPVIGQE